MNLRILSTDQADQRVPDVVLSISHLCDNPRDEVRPVQLHLDPLLDPLAYGRLRTPGAAPVITVQPAIKWNKNKAVL